MALDRPDRSGVAPSELNNDPWWLFAILILLAIPIAIGLVYLISYVLVMFLQSAGQ